MGEKYREMGGEGGAADGMKTDRTSIAEVKPLWDSVVRSKDATPGSFVIFVYDKSSKTYKCTAQGGSGEEFVAACSDDEMNMCGLKANVDGKDMFFHVLFIGLNVGVVQRGRAQLLKAAPFNEMSGSSGELDIPVGDAITKEGIIDLIKAHIKGAKEIRI